MRRFLLLFWLIIPIEAKFNISSNEITRKVLSDVTFELFDKRNIKFDYVTLGKTSELINDTINEMLKANSKAMERTVQIKKVSSLSEWFGQGALVFVKLLSKVVQLFQDYNAEGSRLILFIQNAEADSAMDLLSELSSSNAGNVKEVFFLIEGDTAYELKTFTFWSEKACNEFQLVDINSFDKETGKWKKELEISEIGNYHGCTLKMFTHIYLIPAYDIIYDSGYAYIYTDIMETINLREEKEKEIQRIFEQKLNFTAIRGRTKFDNDLQINLGYGFGDSGTCSVPWVQFTCKVMFSPPEPYTNYEKMILPFDYDTWFFLILVFCSCFVGIFIINQLPLMIREMVYGQGINMPSFNVTAIMFGMGQTRLPENNFGRMILMTFILFCLVMRTAYQGVFFEMFTSDIRRSPPETFADLKERNYTVHFMRSEHYDMNLFGYVDDADRPRVVYVNGFPQMLDIFQRLSDWSMKAAIPSTEVDMKVHRGLKQNVQKTLKEEINWPAFGICLPPGHFFTKDSEKISNYLASGGIIQYWFSYLLDFEMKPFEDDPREPQVFSVGDLSFGFTVWLIACAITMVAFLAELCYFYGKKLAHNLWLLIRQAIGVILIVRFLSKKTLM